MEEKRAYKGQLITFSLACVCLLRTHWRLLALFMSFPLTFEHSFTSLVSSYAISSLHSLSLKAGQNVWWIFWTQQSTTWWPTTTRRSLAIWSLDHALSIPFNSRIQTDACSWAPRRKKGRCSTCICAAGHVAFATFQYLQTNQDGSTPATGNKTVGWQILQADTDSILRAVTSIAASASLALTVTNDIPTLPSGVFRSPNPRLGVNFCIDFLVRTKNFAKRRPTHTESYRHSLFFIP